MNRPVTPSRRLARDHGGDRQSALWALLPFTIFCVFFSMVLGGLRLAAGSIWPAVVGHAVNNTVVFGFVQVVVADKADEPRIDGWLTGLSGWQGWLIMLIPVALLALRTRTSQKVAAADRHC